MTLTATKLKKFDDLGGPKLHFEDAWEIDSAPVASNLDLAKLRKVHINAGYREAIASAKLAPNHFGSDEILLRPPQLAFERVGR